MAHINEHVAFEYRKQIEQQMGIPLPKMDEELQPEMEVEISRMMAMASQKLIQKNTAEAQQQQAQQAAQDPVVQMQQQELQIKAGELDLKKQKLQVDAADKADRLEVEKERIAAQKEIAGMQVGAKVAKDRQEFQGKMELEGIKVGSQIAKERAVTTKGKPPTGE